MNLYIPDARKIADAVCADDLTANLEGHVVAVDPLLKEEVRKVLYILIDTFEHQPNFLERVRVLKDLSALSEGVGEFLCI